MLDVSLYPLLSFCFGFFKFVLVVCRGFLLTCVLREFSFEVIVTLFYEKVLISNTFLDVIRCVGANLAEA